MVAAPVFSRIVQRILSLRQAPLRHSAPLVEEHTPPASRARIFTCVGLSRKAATDALKRLGMDLSHRGRGRRVVGQHVDVAENSGFPVFVVCDHSVGATRMQNRFTCPTCAGRACGQAVAQLTQLGLQIKISGSGRVTVQSPEPGVPVQMGTCVRG